MAVLIIPNAGGVALKLISQPLLLRSRCMVAAALPAIAPVSSKPITVPEPRKPESRM